MKFRIIMSVLLCALCLSFAACGENNADKENDAAVSGSAEAENDGGSGTFTDLPGIAESVREYYGDGMTYVFKADEYSDEVLEFTYGLYDERFTDAVDDFVLSEYDGMSADTFAIVTFKKGTDKALIEEAAEVMEEEYVTGLKNKLSAYNPEEFKASDGYKTVVYDDAILMVISSENTEPILKVVGK